jgi:hypothetical protein
MKQPLDWLEATTYVRSSGIIHDNA